MAKVDEAKQILKALGLPPAQQTDIAAYTLLALANLGPKKPWSAAKRHSIRIHDVLQFTQSAFKKTYAENTRETVRRQVIHQFEQARVIDRNPDEPELATNSPRTHYAISEGRLRLFEHSAPSCLSPQRRSSRTRMGVCMRSIPRTRQCSVCR